MSDLEQFSKAVKSLTITKDTILFVDIDQFPVSLIENHEALPKGLLIIGVLGEPNVLAMTRQELQKILDQKSSAMKYQGGENVQEHT